jgi:hypothetical protein
LRTRLDLHEGIIRLHTYSWPPTCDQRLASALQTSLRVRLFFHDFHEGKGFLIANFNSHVKPGGFIEVIEWAEGRAITDDGTDKDSAIPRYYDRLNEACDKVGRPFRLPKPLKEMVSAAGFINYRETICKMPFGPWPADKKLKLIGRWYLSSMETAFEAYGLAMFTRVLNMDPREAKELCGAVWKDVQNNKIHSYANT